MMSINTFLNRCKVENAPPSVYYIPNFITAEEETQIMKKVYSSPKPKWTYLSHRRLQDYGGVPHKNGMIIEDIPMWLQYFVKRVNSLQVFDSYEANHVLINEYLPNQGIMPHTDGPLFYPCVTTITCGSHSVLEFSDVDKNRNKICDLLLEKRSLVIIKDDMYSKYLHSIAERDCDVISKSCVNIDKTTFAIGDNLQRDTRISLTIRNVPKVCKIKLLK